MRPPSTTTPLPIRSSPRMRVEGCPLGTVAWMLTIVGSSSLTNSGETSMASGSARSQVATEERLDTLMGIGVGAGIVADGGTAAATRLVAVLHVVEKRFLLPHHVEVVISAGVEDDRRVGAAAAHGLDHL